MNLAQLGVCLKSWCMIDEGYKKLEAGLLRLFLEYILLAVYILNIEFKNWGNVEDNQG